METEPWTAQRIREHLPTEALRALFEEEWEGCQAGDTTHVLGKWTDLASGLEDASALNVDLAAWTALTDKIRHSKYVEFTDPHSG